MTPGELRALVPALEQLTWLNAAASSPPPRPVHEAESRHLEETARRGDLGFGAWARLREELRGRLAAHVGCAPRQVAFVPSTSFAFHVLAQLLKARGVIEVVTLETEFPSTTLPLLGLGLTLRGVRAGPHGTYPVEAVERALRPTTGAIAVSAVQYASGYRVDLPGLAALCERRGLVLAVNAAQALGQLPLSLRGVDFLAGPSHKWLMGGYGVAMLALGERLMAGLPSALAGWLSVEPADLWATFAGAQRTDDPAGFTASGVRVRADAAALEVGSPPWARYVALNEAMKLVDAVGPAAIHAHVVGLQLELRRRLRELGFVPNTQDEPAAISGICVVPVEGSPADAVRALGSMGIITTPRGVGVRISTHVYNTLEDVDRLIHALPRLGIKPGPPSGV